jgi:uncharacterized membrane protein YbhN (UPF0104 family)
MTVVLASTQAVPDVSLPRFEPRALARRLALPMLAGALAVAFVLLAGSRAHAFTDGVRRGLGISPRWAALGVGLELTSLVGYVALLSLVVGRVTARIGIRQSAQITLAGAAATRLLPTAGAGGLGLTTWALHRAGLRARATAQTVLVFLVVLYSVFLAAIAVSGSLLALKLVAGRGPIELSGTAAGAALLGMLLCLALAVLRSREPERTPDALLPGRCHRIRAGARLIGEAVREACALLRSRDPRLAGAVAYWTCDAAVLWVMMRAFGAPAAIAVVALAYFVGQVANTLPLPGSVSGGMVGVLVAFGVPAELAIPSVLAYRAISVWLPAPIAIAAVPALRATVARWGREDGSPAHGSSPLAAAHAPAVTAP